MEKSDLKTRKRGVGSIKQAIDFLIVLFILLIFYPYEFYSAYLNTPTNLSSLLYISLFALTIGMTLLFSRNKVSIPSVFYIVVLIQCFGYVLCNLAKGNAFPTGPIMMSFLAVALIIYLSSTIGLEGFFKKYNRWILIMAGLGVISLVLVWTGILRVSVPFLDLSDDEFMYNFFLTFSNHNTADSFKYCGFFDEPGAMASWGMFALLMNRLFVKDGKLEKVLIILLLATFSLGYYIQLVAYLLFFHVFHNKKSRVGSIFLIVALLGFYLVLNSFQGTEYQSIYDNTIDRIESILDDSRSSGIAVDDREDLTIQARIEFERHPIWGTTADSIEFGNNIYEPLAMYGIVGSFFVYFPFIFLLILSIRRQDRELLECMIVIILGFTHRPFHVNMLSFFIVYSFIAMYYQRHSSHKSQLQYY